MHSIIRGLRCTALGIGVLALCLTSPALGAAPSPRSKTVKLKRSKVKPGTFRAGYGISESIPKEGLKVKLGRREVWFFDLDGNGAIEPEKDGLAMKGFPFVVRLTEALLLENGQFRLQFDEEQLTLTPEDLGLDRRIVTASAVFTDLRLRGGVSPVRIDAQASKHCGLHINYLKLNGMADGWGGMAAHNEDPDKPGYTEEGEIAGSASNIGFMKGDYRSALLEWYSTAWHGSAMVKPTLRVVGVALKHGVAMLYLLEERGYMDQPFLHPPDGATNVSRVFSAAGELPDPFPEMKSRSLGRGCGFPIHIRPAGNLHRQKLIDAKLFDGRGRAVRGKFSCPENPATEEWNGNSGCAFFIPLGPLNGRTRYQVVFTFEGLDEPIKWSFTTGR